MTVELSTQGQIQPGTKRTDGITLIAVYHFLVAGIFLLGTLVMAIPALVLGVVAVTDDSHALIGMAAVGFVGMIVMALCLLYLAVGYGLWQTRQWARTAALALAVVSLFGFPILTATGGLTLWYLLKAEVAERFT
jgi:hypothetical protein